MGGFQPSGAVVQRKRLCWPQLSELWHADGLPAERADVRRCPRVRSDGRLLRLLAHRLAVINLRRRQYRKLQKLHLAEISDQCRPIPSGGAVAIRRLRSEQCFKWRIPVPSRRRYPNLGQRCALGRCDLQLCQRLRVARTCAGKQQRQWGADTAVLAADAHSDDLRQ